MGCCGSKQKKDDGKPLVQKPVPLEDIEEPENKEREKDTKKLEEDGSTEQKEIQEESDVAFNESPPIVSVMPISQRDSKSSFPEDLHESLRSIGSMRVIVKYEEEINALSALVAEVKIEDSTDFTSHNSLYLKAYLLPDTSKRSKKKGVPQTRANHIVFNDKFVYEVGPEDLTQKTIDIGIWANDFMTREPVAHASVNMFDYGEVKSFDKWFPIFRHGSHKSTSKLLSRDIERMTERSSVTSKDEGPDTFSPFGYGKLTLTIWKDTAAKKLRINVSKGSALKAQDNGSANPYVKLYLIPDPDKKTKKKTKIVKKTTSPVFNEEFEYDYDGSDKSKKLHVSVWHHDMLSRNEFMGELVVDLDTITNNSEESTKVYELSPSCSGSIKLRAVYDLAKDNITLTVIRAQELRHLHITKLADAYAKVVLSPDKSGTTKKKTKIIQKTLNPEWKDSFFFNLKDIPNGKDRVLEVSVYDNTLGKNGYFGKVKIPVSQIIQRKKIIQFYPLIKEED